MILYKRGAWPSCGIMHLRGTLVGWGEGRVTVNGFNKKFSGSAPLLNLRAKKEGFIARNCRYTVTMFPIPFYPLCKLRKNYFNVWS